MERDQIPMMQRRKGLRRFLGNVAALLSPAQERRLDRF
jgi:hypothetical protein